MSYIYVITRSGSRTNIKADFTIHDINGLTRILNVNGRFAGDVRYGKLGGSTSLLKTMKLDEFEAEFKNLYTELDRSIISRYFGKEIDNKYGEGFVKNQLKRIPKKELKTGYYYKDKDGYIFLYLGKVKKRTVIYGVETITEGNGFIGSCGEKVEEGREITDEEFLRATILKSSIKPLVSEVGKYPFEYEKKLKIEKKEGYFRKIDTLYELEILD